MVIKAIFSDIDGTLLHDDLTIGNKTLKAIKALNDKNIPFVIVSARSPKAIYPILKRYNLNTNIISFSGGAILNNDRNVIFNEGFNKMQVKEIIDFIKKEQFDLTWNLYSIDKWVVHDKNDPRVLLEESIVKDSSIQGDESLFENDEKINKILCICNPLYTNMIQEKLRNKFKEYSICLSSKNLLEIMPNNISKGNAIINYCKINNICTDNCVGFGDNYNDESMLKAVKYGVLMDNAPSELKKHFNYITASNNEDGIYAFLNDNKII